MNSFDNKGKRKETYKGKNGSKVGGHGYTEGKTIPLERLFDVIVETVFIYVYTLKIFLYTLGPPENLWRKNTTYDIFSRFSGDSISNRISYKGRKAFV